MKMLMEVQLPPEVFNERVRAGTAGDIIGKILEDTRPESVYFTERDGCRGATMIVEVEKPSDVPRLAEPWFLNFNAECRFRIAMSPGELQQAGLAELGKKWG